MGVKERSLAIGGKRCSFIDLLPPPVYKTPVERRMIAGKYKV
jgi:hypothetical protein